MVPIQLNSGPVLVDRGELERSLAGLEGEFVVLFMSGQDHRAVARELLASGLDLVCETTAFSEAVKRVSGRPMGVDRAGLAVPRLPTAARLAVLSSALAGVGEPLVSPAELVARSGGAILLLD